MTTVDVAAPTETIHLSTVGIDIGSSTTHVMFARLVLERDGVHLSSRYRVVGREVTYEGPIHLTPYSDHYTVDVQQVQSMIRAEYLAAGVAAGEVDTGAVIITGEAALKRNAPRIIDLFAAEAGKFVCATAGPNLEGGLAAHGSGAVAASVGRTVLNVDVGGGTTKFAVVRDGQIVDSAAICVGARLLAWDEHGCVTRVEDNLSHYASSLPRVGELVHETERDAIAGRMADAVVRTIRSTIAGGDPEPGLRDLQITPGLGPWPSLEAITFSGGVAEYMPEAPDSSSSDLGPWLGRALWRRSQDQGLPVERAREGIRATIVGASQYTVQVSGNTIAVSARDSLPMRNLPVILMEYLPDQHEESVEQVRSLLERADLSEGRDSFALGVRWRAEVHHGALAAFCDVLEDALPETVGRSGRPLVLVIDEDIAGLVGWLLVEERNVACPVIAIDQVDLDAWSYIDIGDHDERRNVVPVVVKSLIFR